jgi:hypothetical protein
MEKNITKNQITKKHITKNQITKNNVTKMSSSNELDKYKCDYCNKVLSSRQSKWRHVKSCDNKNQIEKRLEILEDKIISNIDLNSVINIMNLNISSIKTFCQMINTLYYCESIKKITGNIQTLINNNIKSFRFLSQNKNKFEKYLREQINYNLALLNKLEDYSEYIEFQSKKQYLFRNHANNLKEININNDNQIETIEIVDFSEELNVHAPCVQSNDTTSSEKYQLTDSDDFTSDSDYDI